MSTGFAVFTASAALGAVLAVIAVTLTARTAGLGPAAKEGAVLAASLAAYVGICLWLGYSIGAQCAALVASLVPLRIGRRYVTPRYDHTRGDHR